MSKLYIYHTRANHRNYPLKSSGRNPRAQFVKAEAHYGYPINTNYSKIHRKVSAQFYTSTETASSISLPLSLVLLPPLGTIRLSNILEPTFISPCNITPATQPTMNPAPSWTVTGCDASTSPEVETPPVLPRVPSVLPMVAGREPGSVPCLCSRWLLKPDDAFTAWMTKKLARRRLNSCENGTSLIVGELEAQPVAVNWPICLVFVVRGALCS